MNDRIPIGNPFYADFELRRLLLFMDGIGGFDRAAACGGNLDFDPHPRVGKAGRDHGRRRPDLSEVAAQDGPAGLEILEFGQDIAHPNDILEAAAGLGQRRPRCYACIAPPARPRRWRWSSSDSRSPSCRTRTPDRRRRRPGSIRCRVRTRSRTRSGAARTSVTSAETGRAAHAAFAAAASGPG